MHPLSVILKPVISEKTTSLHEKGNKYTFEIRLDASKEDVKKAVKRLWGVEVVSVNTIVRRGKIKRRGRMLTTPRKTKRAFVTLASGVKLPFFEDQ